MADWGVPDWRDASAYPKAETTATREWWWEFTRRRPDYRRLWQGAHPLEGETHRYAPDVDEFRLKFELTLIHDPALALSDWDLKFYRHPKNYSRSPRELLAERWSKPGAEKAAAIAEHRGRLAEDEGHLLYNFDLSHPLGPQLEQAERYLKLVQEELFGKVGPRRPRPDNWTNFLRVLDGRDAGASLAEIAVVLWPGQEKTPQSARDTFDAACALRDNFPI